VDSSDQEQRGEPLDQYGESRLITRLWGYDRSQVEALLADLVMLIELRAQMGDAGELPTFAEAASQALPSTEGATGTLGLILPLSGRFASYGEESLRGALLAARMNHKAVKMEDFEVAKDKVLMGTERKSLIISDEEKKITAYHEAGHALVAVMLPDADPLHKVTIIPRGMALGATQLMPEEERHTLPEEYLKDRLAMLLAGRSSEKVLLGSVSSGADDDIRQAVPTVDLADDHRVQCAGEIRGLRLLESTLPVSREEVQEVAARRSSQHILMAVGVEVADDDDRPLPHPEQQVHTGVDVVELTNRREAGQAVVEFSSRPDASRCK